MRNDYKIRPRLDFKKGGKAFPDLNKDGKITKADILKGRKVAGFKKGGMSKKADMMTKDMSEKKKGKMMKSKR
jgi:hypothetical protein